MSIRSRGSALFFYYDGTLHEVACPRGFSGLTMSREGESEDCITAEFDHLYPGKGSVAPLSFDIAYDPSESSHEALYEAMKAGAEEIPFALRFGRVDKQSASPTYTSGNDTWTLAAGENWATIHGYVAEFLGLTLEGGSRVGSSVSVQPHDFPDVVPAGGS